MKHILFMFLLLTAIVVDSSADAQQPKVYRIGVLLPGEAWYEIIDGLRAGLRQLGARLVIPPGVLARADRPIK